MTVDEIKAMVMRFVDEPWNKGNVDYLDQICAPDYTLHHDTESKIQKLADLKQAALDARSQVPDLKSTIKDLVVDGDRVVYEWEMTGTMDGKPVRQIGVTLLRLRDGKIVEDRFISELVEAVQPTA